MCRLVGYIGKPMLVADVVLWPDRSIIKQSYDARERIQDPSLPFHLGFGNLNGDGFGIGWFSGEERREQDPTPCMFKSITPAWNNENLARLSCKIVSPVIFAHVRAAYPGMPVSEQNCHPFQWGRYLWMHNGVVGGFNRVRRHLLAVLSDAAYNTVQSFHSDSAVCFALFLNELGPDLTVQQPPDVLLRAMQATLSTITRIQKEHGVTDTSLLNFVVSDGISMIATRFVYPEGEPAASLYYAEGADFERQGETLQLPASTSGQQGVGVQGLNPGGAECTGKGSTICRANNLVGSSVLQEASYSLTYGERGASVAFVASEPITGSTTDWVSVPVNTALVITREKGGYLNIMRAPISPCGTPPAAAATEVGVCLEAISRGLSAKSRAWVPERRKSADPGGGLGDGGESEVQPGLVEPGSAAAQQRDGLISLGRAMSMEPAIPASDEEHRLTGHSGPILACALDEGSRRLYTSSTDCTVRVWDLEPMAPAHVLAGHTKPVTQLVLAGGRLYTAAGGVVRVWRVDTFACVDRIKTSFYSGGIRSMQVTTEGRLYIGHQDTTVKMYLLTSGTEDGSLTSQGRTTSTATASTSRATSSVPTTTNLHPADSATVSALSPTALSLNPAVSGLNPAASGLIPAVFNQERGVNDSSSTSVRPPDAVSSTVEGHVGPVNALVVTGQYICSAGGDAMVRVWRASDLSLVRVLRGHRGSILCLLAVGNLLLSGARDNAIRVWDLDMDMMCRRTLLGHKDDVTHLSALPPRRRYATNPDGNFGASRLANGGSLTSAGASALASFIASSSADGTVRVWSPSWSCIRILTVNPASVGTHLTGQGSGFSSDYAHAGSQLAGYNSGTGFSSGYAAGLSSGYAAGFSSAAGASPRMVGRQAAATPAALTCDVSRSVVVSGYSDATLRIWHVDELLVTAAEFSSGGIPLGGVPLGNVNNSLGRLTINPAVLNPNGWSAPERLRGLLTSPDSATAAAAAATANGSDYLSTFTSPPLSPTASGLLFSPQSFSIGEAGGLCLRPCARWAAGGGLCAHCGSSDQRLVRSLRDFVAIKTVSADKKLHDECLRGAKYLSRLLESLGAEVKVANHAEGKNPVVMGRLGNNPDHPTVAFYGHYDVQPAEEPEWTTSPFELCAVDGHLYGRGTSDNKGPVLAFVYAIKEMLDCWQEAGATPPVNFAFMFEGEEENGSIGFREAVVDNMPWFGDANLVVISNTVWVGENVPCLTYGMRGMITASVEVVGPQRDIHSGNDGGVFNEPMIDLAKVLATLVDGQSQIQVPGFYDRVRPRLIDLAWAGLEHSQEFSMDMYKDAIGVQRLTAPPNKHDLLAMRWCQPSLSVVDVRSTDWAPTHDTTGPSTPKITHSTTAPTASTAAAAAAQPSVTGAGPAGFGPCAGHDHYGSSCSSRGGSSSARTSRQLQQQQQHGAGDVLDADRSSYRFGPTRFSVIPRMAVGKVSIRYVPEQDAEQLITCLRRHLEQQFAALGSSNSISIHVHSVGDWWEADPESRLFKMAERAVRKEWGVDPLYVREGGTMPVASLIEKLVGAPALMVPMGQSSDNAHLANERLRRLNLVKGKNVIRHLLEELAGSSGCCGGADGAAAAAKP